jgi:hypothetical protein
MSRDIKAYIKICEACQRRKGTRFEESLFFTAFSSLWSKVRLDIVYMPSCDGKHFFIIARDDFSD